MRLCCLLACFRCLQSIFLPALEVKAFHPRSGSIIYLGEWLNKEGRQHWENFASQNYFDEQGVFFSALVSLPLLILLFILLVGACTRRHSDNLSFCWCSSSFTCDCSRLILMSMDTCIWFIAMALSQCTLVQTCLPSCSSNCHSAMIPALCRSTTFWLVVNCSSRQSARSWGSRQGRGGLKKGGKVTSIQGVQQLERREVRAKKLNDGAGWGPRLMDLTYQIEQLAIFLFAVIRRLLLLWCVQGVGGQNITLYLIWLGTPHGTPRCPSALVQAYSSCPLLQA